MITQNIALGGIGQCVTQCALRSTAYFVGNNTVGTLGLPSTADVRKWAVQVLLSISNCFIHLYQPRTTTVLWL